METEHKIAIAILISLFVIFGSFVALIGAHGADMKITNLDSNAILKVNGQEIDSDIYSIIFAYPDSQHIWINVGQIEISVSFTVSKNDVNKTYSQLYYDNKTSTLSDWPGAAANVYYRSFTNRLSNNTLVVNFIEAQSTQQLSESFFNTVNKISVVANAAELNFNDALKSANLQNNTAVVVTSLLLTPSYIKIAAGYAAQGVNATATLSGLGSISDVDMDKGVTYSTSQTENVLSITFAKRLVGEFSNFCDFEDGTTQGWINASVTSNTVYSGRYSAYFSNDDSTRPLYKIGSFKKGEQIDVYVRGYFDYSASDGLYTWIINSAGTQKSSVLNFPAPTAWKYLSWKWHLALTQNDTLFIKLSLDSGQGNLYWDNIRITVILRNFTASQLTLNENTQQSITDNNVLAKLSINAIHSGTLMLSDSSVQNKKLIATPFFVIKKDTVTTAYTYIATDNDTGLKDLSFVYNTSVKDTSSQFYLDPANLTYATIVINGTTYQYSYIPDPVSSNASGGSGTPTDPNILTEIKDFILAHFFTILFGALTIISAFARNGKAFLLFAALTAISYYYIDPNFTVTQLIPFGGG